MVGDHGGSARRCGCIISVVRNDGGPDGDHYGFAVDLGDSAATSECGGGSSNSSCNVTSSDRARFWWVGFKRRWVRAGGKLAVPKYANCYGLRSSVVYGSVRFRCPNH